MRTVPMLVVKSTVPSLLYLNNAPAGEIGPDTPAGIPMPENGPCYLHYVPLARGCLPGAFRLDFHDGELAPVGEDLPARVTLWPRGVVEAEIEPQSAPDRSFVPLAPDTLSFVDLTGNRRAYLLRYVSHWLVIEENSGGTLLSLPLPGERVPELVVLNLDGREAVAAKAPGPNCDWVVIAAEGADGWQELFRLTDAQVELDGHGNVTSLAALGDTAGHGELTTWQYADGRYTESRSIVWLDGEPHLPQSAEDTARAFLEAWLVGQSDEAMDYLSEELRSGLGLGDIANFLGNYEAVSNARYAPFAAEGEVTLALLRRENGVVTGARPVAIKCIQQSSDTGQWKVDNIRAL